jgi:DNA-binding NarL/FixJ family response regulator
VIVLCEDPITHAGLTSTLRFRPEVRIESEAALGQPGSVALVVCDAVDDSTLCTLRRLARTSPARLVLVAARIDDAALLEVVETGVCGVIRRSEASAERLAATIRAASAGDGSVPSDLLGRLLGQVGRMQRTVLTQRGLAPASLSEREISVLRLAADGWATSEIAERLRYSERTVKNVLHDITTRMNLRNRCHAVAYALRAGII